MFAIEYAPCASTICDNATLRLAILCPCSHLRPFTISIQPISACIRMCRLLLWFKIIPWLSFNAIGSISVAIPFLLSSVCLRWPAHFPIAILLLFRVFPPISRFAVAFLCLFFCSSGFVFQMFGSISPLSSEPSHLFLLALFVLTAFLAIYTVHTLPNKIVSVPPSIPAF